jgi:hypothetical protein
VRHLWVLTTGAALANTGAALTLTEVAAGADTAEQAGAKTLRSWAVLLPSAFCWPQREREATILSQLLVLKR